MLTETLGATHTYHAAHAWQLWEVGAEAVLQDLALGTRWHMMKMSSSESDSRNIREADRGSHKDTPEPARKILVAWPWEKAKSEQAWVLAQKKLGSVKRESTTFCFDSCCAQGNKTLCTFFLNKQKHINKHNSLSSICSPKKKEPVGTLNIG